MITRKQESKFHSKNLLQLRQTFLASAAFEQVGGLIQSVISLKVISGESHVDVHFDCLRVVSRRYHILENHSRSAWNAEWLIQLACRCTPILVRLLVLQIRTCSPFRIICSPEICTVISIYVFHQLVVQSLQIREGYRALLIVQRCIPAALHNNVQYSQKKKN